MLSIIHFFDCMLNEVACMALFCRLPVELRESDSCVMSFADVAHEITCTGTETFCAAMQRHKKALMDTIGQAQGTELRENFQLPHALRINIYFL